MPETWNSAASPQTEPIGIMGWVRVLRRSMPLGLLVFGGLIVLLLIRLIERPLYGLRRPVTPYITQWVCRGAFVVMGIRFISAGMPMCGAGAIVANHQSWLDILALNARKRVYFVSKSEVAGWPGIGWLARATGTVFIKRKRQEAGSQVRVFRDRLTAGHKLLFFPEGTSTDGQQVLAFKPTLFAAFFDDALKDRLQIQPVTVNYIAPEGADHRCYGWWGDMGFGPHLLAILTMKTQGQVCVTYHAPVNVCDFEDRKALAKATEETVRGGLGPVDIHFMP